MKIDFDVLPERMPRIPEERLTETQKMAIEEVVQSRGGLNGSFVALVHAPELMEKVQRLGAYVRFNGSLDLRINRVASLLTTRWWSSQYQWSGNTELARSAGLKEEVIQAIGEGRRPAEMARDEAAVYDFVVEALTNMSVSDVTYKRAVEEFSERGILDILAIVSYYGMLALIMNVVRTPLPQGKAFSLSPMPEIMRFAKRFD